MTLDNRKNIRLKEYDYSSPGAYFITLCTKNRKNYFWQTVVQQLKGYVSKQIGESIWQKSYYDHVIRGQQDYLEICQYIIDNPLKWAQDNFYT